jgi:hypothetical protein
MKWLHPLQSGQQYPLQKTLYTKRKHHRAESKAAGTGKCWFRAARGPKRPVMPGRNRPILLKNSRCDFHQRKCVPEVEIWVIAEAELLQISRSNS